MDWLSELGDEKSILLWGILGFLLFFGLQLFCCRQKKRPFLKVLPGALFLLCAGVALALYRGAETAAAQQRVLHAAASLGVALPGLLAAWAIHGLLSATSKWE